MQYFLTGEQMQSCDRHTIQELGIPSLELMERAASKCVEMMEKKGLDLSKPCVVCGSGNNGGDGIAVARMLAEKGEIEEHMMYNTFNMGLGMILAVNQADVFKTIEAIKAAGETPYIVGHIESQEKGVTLC